MYMYMYVYIIYIYTHIRKAIIKAPFCQSTTLIFDLIFLKRCLNYVSTVMCPFVLIEAEKPIRTLGSLLG